jgi:hypothetical protein
MIIPRNTEDLLHGILQTLSLEIRGKVCIGYQTLPLTTANWSYLSIPIGAITAELTLEINDSQTPKAVGARYTLNGTNPETGNISSKTGVPIGDGDTIEIRGGDNLRALKIIDSGNGSNTRNLKIQYFK